MTGASAPVFFSVDSRIRTIKDQRGLPPSILLTRECFLMAQHALSHSLQRADATIAATALELGVDLLTGNDKHYRPVQALGVEVIRPGPTEWTGRGIDSTSM